MPYIILAVLLVISVAAIKLYNDLVRLRNHVEEAFSTMDVYLKKRYDLIPNLVETVKGYAAHEKNTIDGVAEARKRVGGASNSDERIKCEGELESALKNLFALSEAYPELKANENFSQLHQSLGTIETDIANSRKYYNGVVKAYNTKTEVFPTNIIAGIFGFKRKPLYVLDNATERNNVSVKF